MRLRILDILREGEACVCPLPVVLDKTCAARRVITVDGCPFNCALKIVERAGFTPDRTINLVQDCGLKKGPPLEYGDEELQVTIDTILSTVQDRR